jgi:hypothetical protein
LRWLFADQRSFINIRGAGVELAEQFAQQLFAKG